ncbi:hypothetical protein GXW82_15280 [Streptacidiphilus sp. 4-A2]|nr:hypothetical protein [Streptacidiphilus sp. 4-A2]
MYAVRAVTAQLRRRTRGAVRVLRVVFQYVATLTAIGLLCNGGSGPDWQLIRDAGLALLVFGTALPLWQAPERGIPEPLRFRRRHRRTVARTTLLLLAGAGVAGTAHAPGLAVGLLCGAVAVAAPSRGCGSSGPSACGEPPPPAAAWSCCSRARRPRRPRCPRSNPIGARRAARPPSTSCPRRPGAGTPVAAARDVRCPDDRFRPDRDRAAGRPGPAVQRDARTGVDRQPTAGARRGREHHHGAAGRRGPARLRRGGPGPRVLPGPAAPGERPAGQGPHPQPYAVYLLDHEGFRLARIPGPWSSRARTADVAQAAGLTFTAYDLAYRNDQFIPLTRHLFPYRHPAPHRLRKP